MTVSVFNFTDADSGCIRRNGLGLYSISTGYANCIISYVSSTLTRQYAIFRFDTSSIPIGSTVTMVEFFNTFALACPPPGASNTSSRLGAWCGANLDASANDFNAPGSLDLNMSPLGWPNNTWMDLSSGGPDPTGYINLGGVTDVQFRDDDLVTGYGCWNSAKGKCQLRVTYTPPASTLHLLSLTGVGT